MKILVSNDDGVFAPGILALVAELKTIPHAEVIVIAPDRNRSGASNSLSLTRPVRLKQLDNGHYCVEGTPTDCVHLALTGLLETNIDMVISGINDGANLGDDVIYSGTVAAAMEGRHLGFPAIAVSLVGESVKHYETAAVVARQLALQVYESSLPNQTILNVNVPDLPLEQIGGFDITRLGTRHAAQPMVKQIDPRGRPIYWVGPPGLEADAGPGTDFYALTQQKVSITPLHLDLTHYKLFDELSSWVNRIDLAIQSE